MPSSFDTSSDTSRRAAGTVEPGQYAENEKSQPRLRRLMLGIFALFWALVFCGLAVLRADLARPISLVWAVLLLALALGAAYAGLYAIVSWWRGRKS